MEEAKSAEQVSSSLKELADKGEEFLIDFNNKIQRGSIDALLYLVAALASQAAASLLAWNHNLIGCLAFCFLPIILSALAAIKMREVAGLRSTRDGLLIVQKGIKAASVALESGISDMAIRNAAQATAPKEGGDVLWN